MRRLPPAVQSLPDHVRVDAALEALEPGDRHVLALILIERLTPIEAAGVLRMTVRQVEQALDHLLAHVANESGVARPRRTLRRAA